MIETPFKRLAFSQRFIRESRNSSWLGLAVTHSRSRDSDWQEDNLRHRSLQRGKWKKIFFQDKKMIATWWRLR